MIQVFYAIRGHSGDTFPSCERAVAEAARKAEANPGNTYYVMKAIKVVKKVETTVSDLYDPEKEGPIPF